MGLGVKLINIIYNNKKNAPLSSQTEERCLNN